MTTLLHDPRRGLPSASSMARLELCPGSLALIESLRRDALLFEPPDPDRDAGNRIHAYLAGAQIELVEAELQTARKAAELRDALVNDWLGLPLPPNLPADFERMVEQRLWFRRGIMPVFSGQPDFVIVDHARNRGLIINYKSGRREAQPAADNLQLRTEAVALRAAQSSLVEISGAIVEPWVSWSPVRVKYDERALQEAQKEILAIVDRVLWESDNRMAGEWCFYCKARAACPEARAHVAELYRLGLKVKDPLAELPRGERGSKIIEDISTVRQILDAMEEAYRQILAQEPDALASHYLHEGNRRRSFADLAKARERLRTVMSDQEIDGCATWWVGKVEERFAHNRGLKLGLTTKVAENAFAEFMADLIETTRGPAYIMRLTAKERKRRALANETREAVAK